MVEFFGQSPWWILVSIFLDFPLVKRALEIIPVEERRVFLGKQTIGSSRCCLGRFSSEFAFFRMTTNSSKGASYA